MAPHAEQEPDIPFVVVPCKQKRGKHKHMSDAERKNLSRERNRVHAQRTRQRKKEQMMTLQTKATELKEEQIHLKQTINDKTTASILVHMFAEGSSGKNDNDDPTVERILQRPPEEIPDASQIPELPTLVLPGQHASKKMKAQLETAASDSSSPTDTSSSVDCSINNSGIDYALLGRDRSQCTASELDAIRRERNRMHAKRTRDRKRLYTERMADICRQLQDENLLLHRHLQSMDPSHTFDEQPAAVVQLPTTTPPKKRQRITTPTPQQQSPVVVAASPTQQQPQHHTHMSALLLLAASLSPPPHEVSDSGSAGESSGSE